LMMMMMIYLFWFYFILPRAAVRTGFRLFWWLIFIYWWLRWCIFLFFAAGRFIETILFIRRRCDDVLCLYLFYFLHLFILFYFSQESVEHFEICDDFDGWFICICDFLWFYLFAAAMLAPELTCHIQMIYLFISCYGL
jgi:hypothetical protein